MKALSQWFEEYGESHQNKTNRILHKICVPVIFFSLVGMLLQIPVNLGPVKLGEAVLAVLLALYIRFGLRPFFVMVAQLFVCYLVLYAMGQVFSRPLYILIVLFVLAWIGQFWGHHVEGKKPSFFKDLQYLLIGPLWVVKDLFKLT